MEDWSNTLWVPEFTAQALEKKWRSDGCMSNEIIFAFISVRVFMYKLKIPPSPHGKFPSNFSEVAFVFTIITAFLKKSIQLSAFFQRMQSHV